MAGKSSKWGKLREGENIGRKGLGEGKTDGR